jgi:hypothetical protein
MNDHHLFLHPRKRRRLPALAHLMCAGLALFLSGCAAIGGYSNFEHRSINEVRFRDRALSKYDDEVRVTVAVPREDETEELFGADLTRREIQPIWVKVENHSEHVYYLISSAVDPKYFSPNEAAFAAQSGLRPSAREKMARYFRTVSFKNPVLPNTAVSGFIYTNWDAGEKAVQVDLFGDRRIKFFTFFVQIPGMRIDYRSVDFDTLYPQSEMVDLTKEELRKALEKLPCCTTDQNGTQLGDPINLVIIGDFTTVASAFIRRGWLSAEETYSSAVWKTVKSFLFGSRYRYSPVSSLYFFGRHQDFARQKPRNDIHERNHLRLWMSNMRFNGKPVFVGQVSRDIGVRFTSKAWPPVTHKVDPDVDEARHALIEDLFFSQAVSHVGFVKGVGVAKPSQPRTNLTGDPYFTDGLRAVLFLDPGPLSLEEIRGIKWERPMTFRILPLD